MKSLPILLITLLANLSSLSGHAADANGKTANGCTYSVVNGQYFSKCPPGEGLSNATRSELVANNSNPAESSRRGNATTLANAPAEVVSPSLPRDASDVSVIDANYSTVNSTTASARSSSHDFKPFYMMGSIGRANSILDSAISARGYSLGIALGTYLTDHIGAELGYDYANADTLLGLERRSNGAIQSQLAQVGPAGSSANAILEDSTLVNHMIHFGFNFYLTDLESFVRPYAGLGVGYRSSTLEENFPSGTRGAGGAFLNQTSFGANLNFGLQFRFSDAIRSMAAFRYYRPVINSDPEFDRGSTLNYFNLSDTKLTSAPLRQLVASLQYVF